MRLLLLAATFLALATTAHAASYAGKPIRQGDLSLPARVSGQDIQLAIGGRFATRFWPGVNLGVTVPGHAPGELAPTRKDYDRWLDGMQELGVRAVRVYTILRPRFYEALAAHNRRHPKTPLYFIQGVWIPEEDFLRTQNAYAITTEFDREIADAVDVVHGEATLRPRRGHASGRYRTDVSRWLLAWSPGVEWDPGAVARTDAVNAGAPPHAGRFIQATPDATPMESWIAARLDHLATLEARRGWSRPITFTNWLTADPLPHPMEPLFETEDRVSVDAKHVQATAQWPGGFFASYHAYPYYPDFLRFEYAGGQPSPYAAYLRQLRQHHAGQALMVTEFGVPTGLGAAHRGPLGRDQGDHDEREAARIDAAMMREIEQTGYSGAVLFEWTDEWFKRTWNTQDIARPVDRRPLWHNVLTNETQFGVIAVEPGRKPAVTLDGRTDEWGAKRIKHDAAYLYLRARNPSTIDIDVRPDGGPDLRVIVGPGKRARFEQPSAADPIPSVFATGQRTEPWVSPRLILSRPLTLPTGQALAPEFLDLGTLRWGGSDVRRLAAGSGGTVELRIPWLLLGFADPSSRTVYTPQPTGVTFARVGSIRVDGRRYSWRTWNQVDWHERRKQGWPILKSAFARAAR